MHFRSALVLATGLLFLACSKSPQPSPPPASVENQTGATNTQPGTTTVTGAPNTTEARPVPQERERQPQGPAQTGQMQEQAGVAPLGDEQIVAIEISAHTGQIDQGKLAAAHSTNPKVKAFAERMVKEHTALLQDDSQLAQRQHIAPVDNSISMHLNDDSRQLMDTLRTEKGKDFDRGYIAAVVKEHKQLVDTIDTRLLPNAKNAEVKTALHQLRTKIENHLREAEEIQRSLGNVTR